MSLALGIDTATADTVVAVAGEGRRPVEVVVGPDPGGRPRHAPELMAAIERVVAEAGGWGPIGLIAVGLGPGSFTGLRIGISTARALAQGRDLPIAGASSTAALATALAEANPGRPCLGVIDARRGEVFAEAHDGSGPLVVAPDGLGAAIGAAAGALACGDGALRFRAEIEAQGIEVATAGDPLHRISAARICALAGAGEPGGPAAITPTYLRRPDAERWLQRDRSDS